MVHVCSQRVPKKAAGSLACLFNADKAAIVVDLVFPLPAHEHGVMLRQVLQTTGCPSPHTSSVWAAQHTVTEW